MDGDVMSSGSLPPMITAPGGRILVPALRLGLLAVSGAKLCRKVCRKVRTAMMLSSELNPVQPDSILTGANVLRNWEVFGKTDGF